MCGSEGKMFKAEIEGSTLTVCRNCSKYGKIITEIREVVEGPKKERKIVERNMPKKEVVFLVADDFADKIKRKRESLDIKQEDFAKKINEKVSLIHQIETGRFTPNLDLARKLEKALGIKLIEQHEEKHDIKLSASKDEFTIGDLIKIKKK